MSHSQTINRRYFLYGVAGASGAATLSGLGLRSQVPGHTQTTNQSSGAVAADNLREHRRAGRAFGTTVSVAAWHTDEQVASDAVDAAFTELLLVEELMSIYQSDSQLSRLNRRGVLDNPHPYFVEVLQASQEMSRRSNGAFDITVQPLWRLFSDAKKAGALPTAAEIERARRAIGWRRVVIAPDQVRLRGRGTQITLNGIAQGYAADRAASALVARGVAHALVDAGEIGAIRDKPSGDSWSVGVQHPRCDDAYVSVARLNGRCLATSGDYATTFSNDYRFNHLFDPRTGTSPTEFASVSIAATTAMLADALSTAVFVLGIDQGLSLVQSTPGADALMVLKDGRVLRTGGFPVDA
jgi:thiamine biosynthesis lipoprotein